MASTPKLKKLRPVRPNAGLEAIYRARLDALVKEMNDSVVYFLKAAYRANEPEVVRLAGDESPAAAMRAAIRKLAARWLKRFDEAAPKLADWFATKAADRSDAVLRKILKDGGFSVEFKMTRAMNDVLQATIGQNVSLIKSIPEKYFTAIEGAVMRSVQTGRDVGALAADLEKNYGVTKRRAAFISLDQNNKATAALTRVRRVEAGLFDAQWVHSGAGKHPRPTHVKASRDKVIFDIREGWLDPAIGKRILPGDEPGCRCVSRPVIKGFS